MKRAAPLETCARAFERDAACGDQLHDIGAGADLLDGAVCDV
jgi:hypothetical protein